VSTGGDLPSDPGSFCQSVGLRAANSLAAGEVVLSTLLKKLDGNARTVVNRARKAMVEPEITILISVETRTSDR
jgi:hypothetical protein